MFWKKNSYFNTLTFRITLLFAVMLSLFSLIIFALVYFNLRTNLNLQVNNTLLADIDELEGIYNQDGIQELQKEFDIEAAADGVSRIFFKLISPEEKLIAASDLSKWQSIDDISQNLFHRPAGSVIETRFRKEMRDNVRILSRKTADGNVFQIGITLQEIEALLVKYKQIFEIIFLLMLILGSGIGWLMARHAMAGINRITKTAAQISQRNLALRVTPGTEGQEIKGLAEAFNKMLERIELLIKEMKEVTNNIAHDLRSPITRIREISETTLTGEQNLAAYRKMTQDIISESDRFVEMINTMLDIAQTESGVNELAQVPVDIAEILKAAHQLFLPVAQDKKINLLINTPEHPLIVLGDRSRLQRLIANLLDNAIKYTLHGGTVSLLAKMNFPAVIIEVSDTGIGMGQEVLSRIFKRFYRRDKSRLLLGNGLGLCLAQAIVKAHRGSISVSSIPDKGTKFTVSIPLSV